MKKFIILSLVFIVLFFVGFLVYSKENASKKENELIKNISDHFSKTVVTNKDSKLYAKEEQEYVEKGSVKDQTILELDNQEIGKETTHFYIKNLDLYISYEDVDIYPDPIKANQRYKEYVVFNESIITPSTTRFYDGNNHLIMIINKSFEFPIIIKSEDAYGIEFNNQLLYVKEVEKVIQKSNTNTATRKNIRTFTYHTVYDTKNQKCASVEICHPIEQFETHMKFLHDENFLTLSMKELEMFLNNEIRIPLRTVAVTLDDGIFLDNSISIVEKYGINATFFIITSRVDVTPYMSSEYARFESHTDDLHNNYRCPKNASYSQGGQMLCEKHENIVNDLRLSQDKLNGSFYFAYPFFDVNSHAKIALKEAGFHLAFVGQLRTNGYSDSSTEKYMVRRKTIFGNYSLNTFMDYCFDRDK